jgi:hypothetical protein
MRRLLMTGLLHFDRLGIVLYLELDPHPGGWRYLELAIVCMVCAVLRGLSAPQSASA